MLPARAQALPLLTDTLTHFMLASRHFYMPFITLAQAPTAHFP